jgi:GTP-binding protein Era
MSPDQQPMRSGYVGLIGRPNVGKSTLLNRLVGQKISITSRRPQTTRHRVLGILTTADAQFIFVDTPGIQQRHGGALNRRLSRAVAQAFELMDAVLVVIEPRLTAEDRRIIAELPSALPAVLAINKIDALEDKTALLPLIRDASTARDWRAVVPVSARTGVGVSDLLAAMAPLLTHVGLLFAEDELTDRSERFLAGELVREKLFRLLGEEVPYATAVEVEQFEHTGGLRRIHATILVDKPGQKAIVIGKGGAKLKEIGTQARLDMEKLFGGKVHLELWVKVREGWAEDPALLKRLGYD